MKPLIYQIIKDNATEKELAWVDAKNGADLKGLQLAFVMAPRFISKKRIIIDAQNEINAVLQISNWTLDRLVRVYFIANLDQFEETEYCKTIETLFETAEINESVALYSAFPIIKYPEKWMYRATEAVRSYVGSIFDTIAFGNSYPSNYFYEQAWNQLVLKCIFNDKPINRIEGIDERANQELAKTLSDFAHERWAASRQVPAQVWRLVQNFMDDAIFEDIEKLLNSDREEDRIAANILLKNSNHSKSKALLEQYPEQTQVDYKWSVLEN